MKKIVALTVASLLLVAMVSGSFWAYFNDVEASGNNTITAGTLDMVPATSGTGVSGKYSVTAGGDGVNGYVVFTKMRPGESGTITWVLTNNGSLPGTLTLPATATFGESSTNEIEAAAPGNNGGGNGDLDAYLGVKLQRGVGTDQANAESNFTIILPADASDYYVPLSGLEAVLDAQSVAMAASSGNDTVVYKLSWAIASDVKGAGADGKFGTGDDVDVNENIIQSDSTQVDIAFALIQ
ncbi:MAG: TasA family protein [Chloroflexota bacterium]